MIDPTDYPAAMVDALAEGDGATAAALRDLALDAAGAPREEDAGLGGGSSDSAARVKADLSAFVRERLHQGGDTSADES